MEIPKFLAFSRQDRYELYKMALENQKVDNEPYSMCDSLFSAFHVFVDKRNGCGVVIRRYRELVDYFPEFAKVKESRMPFIVSGYWFDEDDKDIRLKAFTDMIKEVADPITFEEAKFLTIAHWDLVIQNNGKNLDELDKIPRGLSTLAYTCGFCEFAGRKYGDTHDGGYKEELCQHCPIVKQTGTTCIKAQWGVWSRNETLENANAMLELVKSIEYEKAII